ncbi:hypothetical protein AO073_15635 [Pseudomonas syringae ICMP 11293]|nr:hypothetical protein AO073_15635 [Pseudomonas syringae ICMP 11293]
MRTILIRRSFYPADGLISPFIGRFFSDVLSLLPYRMGESFYQKVDQRPHLRRQMFTGWVDHINTQFYRAVLGEYLNQITSTQILRHHKTGLQRNATTDQGDGSVVAAWA